jgi:hypothetical protein
VPDWRGEGRRVELRQQQQQKEFTMNTNVTVTVGKRLLPLSAIALVEHFDPAQYPDMRTQKVFASRVVLVDRQSVLSEGTVEAFASQYGFRFVAEDQVAASPSIRFAVESFTPAENFVPSKPFKTRLSWRDQDGNTQSKLLLSPPETVLAVVVTGGVEAEAKEPKPAGGGRKPTASIDRRNARRRSPQPAPV